MAYIVTVTHNGQQWPLRRTVIAYSMDRAEKFETREQAQAALEKARPFMKASVYKTAVIREI
jgi:hypothetical protein